MRVIDIARDKIIAERTKKAANIFQRLRGLLGSRKLIPGEALWIPHCRGIHTVGMRYSIDVVFLDQERKVVGCFPSCLPNHLGPILPRADSVLEFPEGTVQESGITVGARLLII